MLLINIPTRTNSNWINKIVSQDLQFLVESELRGECLIFDKFGPYIPPSLNQINAFHQMRTFQSLNTQIDDDRCAPLRYQATQLTTSNQPNDLKVNVPQLASIPTRFIRKRLVTRQEWGSDTRNDGMRPKALVGTSEVSEGVGTRIVQGSL